MAYCSTTDVQALNPKRTYSATSTPTSTQVDLLIDQIAVEIDAVLQAQGYPIPITSPANFIAQLKYVNAYGAGALAEMGMFPETSEMGSTPHWKVLWTTYQDWLKQLRNGETPYAVVPEGGLAASNYTKDSDQANYPDPIFRKSSNDKEF